MSEFADKARSIATPRKWGQQRKTPVLDERNGRVGGFQTEHWNDRMDAEVRPTTLRIKTVTEEADAEER